MVAMDRSAETDSVHTANLRIYPREASGPVAGVIVRIARTKEAMLNVSYEIRARLECIRVPAPAPVRIAQHLWHHTCCELFMRVEGAAGYHELNFSPSGEWAAHAFERYREGRMLADESLDPRIRLDEGVGVIELSATIDLARLSASYPGAPLAFGVAAVIEARDGSCSHWALAHPAEKPDFHHPDAFVLKLDAIRY
jgi:hypothetical protein